jgi:hypothetical protein
VSKIFTFHKPGYHNAETFVNTEYEFGAVTELPLYNILICCIIIVVLEGIVIFDIPPGATIVTGMFVPGKAIVLNDIEVQ